MKSDQLSKAETEVMAVLWRLGAATVSQIQSQLDAERPEGQKLAYTTVATHLNRMVDKGAVTAKKQGRSYIFEPTEERAAFSQSKLSDMVRQLFDGRPSSLASQFIETNSFSDEELDELRRLIDEKSKK